MMKRMMAFTIPVILVVFVCVCFFMNAGLIPGKDVTVAAAEYVSGWQLNEIRLFGNIEETDDVSSGGTSRSIDFSYKNFCIGDGMDLSRRDTVDWDGTTVYTFYDFGEDYYETVPEYNEYDVVIEISDGINRAVRRGDSIIFLAPGRIEFTFLLQNKKGEVVDTIIRELYVNDVDVSQIRTTAIVPESGSVQIGE